MAKKLVIIVSKGTLDMAYPPLMLASTAAALGMEAYLFFTFWGMQLIKKDAYNKLKFSPISNTALGMPNILAILPGMTELATKMIKKKIKEINMPSIPELIKMAKESGVKFYACAPTMEMMKLKKEDLIPEVDDVVGASTVLEIASTDSIVLFI